MIFLATIYAWDEEITFFSHEEDEHYRIEGLAIILSVRDIDCHSR